MDLLRKSDLNENAVAEGGNGVDPEVKPAPSVAIGFFQNTENLEPPNNMLHGESDPHQSEVVGPLDVGERVMLACFPRVRVNACWC